MTAEEVRTYLKSYRNLKDKADYLQNKLINVKAISYRDSPTGSYSEPKTQNDYILMKDRCLEEMALIRQNIDKLDDINHRDVLFYRYIELMSIYDTADMLHVSQRTAEKYIHDAIAKMISWIEEKGIGTKKVNYKLRDWVFSRQRYWGEPIPMVHCDKCGWVPVPEDQLPLVLPDVKDYEPGENGESPLAKHTEWTETTCPHCGGHATRETDTMPQWAGSSWYFLRYMDPHNDKALASKEALEYWSPVDWYNGGMEHTTLHLLYSRFWHKFLYDIGVVPTKEPYAKRTSHGMILGSNGEKMSKSKGNVVNPDDVVNEYGADTLRVYEMFMGPFDQTAPWSVDSIRGCSKFLDRVWNMQEILVDDGTNEYSKQFEKMMHQAIKKVTRDNEEMKFNTSVSTFMTIVNEFYKAKKINKAEFRTFLQLLNPFAPHITEELNEKIGFTQTLAETPWPTFDEEKTKEDVINLPIQVNGKLRANIDIAVNSDEETIKTAVHEAIKDKLDGKTIVKEIYVKNRIYNVVVK